MKSKCKVFTYMHDDGYRDLTPDFPYEVDYRIGANHITLKARGPARYSITSFIFNDENGNHIQKKDLNMYLFSKQTAKRLQHERRRTWKKRRV